MKQWYGHATFETNFVSTVQNLAFTTPIHFRVRENWKLCRLPLRAEVDVGTRH
jgi:hypothetical protein